MSEAAGARGRLRGLRRRRRRSDATMTMFEHLAELRMRLIVSLVAFLAISAIVFVYYDPVLEVLRRPLCSLDRDLLGPQGCDLIYTKVTGGFQFRLKLTALVGLALASPVWIYELWAFVVPALTAKEKRYAFPFLASAITLFLTGAGLAYVALPTGLRLLLTIAGPGTTPLLGAEEYLSFVGLLLLGFGVTFELPLVLLFLGLAEVITLDQLRRQRKLAFVAIVAGAAIITPSQDPYTMLILAVPLYGLYEVTIVVLSALLRRRARPVLES